MKRSLFVLAMAASMLIATPFAHATIIQYTANLSGPNEAPPNASPGTGLATITIDDVLNTLRVEVTFSDVLGTAGVATTTPTFAGFPLGVTSGSYDHTLDMTMASSYNPSFITAHGGTPAGAEALLLNGMSLDQAYFNIHTTFAPGGEIRGFLTQATAQVPEPATLALVCQGLAGLGWSRRTKA